MKVLQKIGDVLDKICGFLIVIMIGAMVIITTAQIICRIWFTALSWSEEVTRFAGKILNPGSEMHCSITALSIATSRCALRRHFRSR